jgi:hypothetical protein
MALAQPTPPSRTQPPTSLAPFRLVSFLAGLRGAIRKIEMGRTSIRPKIVLSFIGNNYGKLNVNTRNFAISARVTEFSGQ